MNNTGRLSFDYRPSELPADPKSRHEVLVDCFGQFLFWLRNWSTSASRGLVESADARERLGTIRRTPYEGVAAMTKENRDAALLFAQETLDGFLERFLWSLGDEGTDARFGPNLAYRFRVEMEIVNVDTGDICDEEPINRGGRFMGSNWGRWLNRYSAPADSNEDKLPE